MVGHEFEDPLFQLQILELEPSISRLERCSLHVAIMERGAAILDGADAAVIARWKPSRRASFVEASSRTINQACGLIP
jgi:hypothetical protein